MINIKPKKSIKKSSGDNWKEKCQEYQEKLAKDKKGGDILRSKNAMEISTKFLVDGSASMQSIFIYPSLFNNLKNVHRELLDSTTRVFGARNEVDQRNTSITNLRSLLQELRDPRICSTGRHYTVSLFNTCTSPQSMITSIPELLSDQRKTNLVFISDGEFSPSGSVSGSKLFASIISQLNAEKLLDNVVGILVFFPEGVSNYTVNTLKQDLTGVILELSARYVPVIFAEARNHSLQQAIDSLPQNVQITPPGHQSLGEFSWKENQNASQVAASIRRSEYKDEIIAELISKMLHAVRTDTKLLEHGIYSKTHAILRYLSQTEEDVKTNYIHQVNNISSSACSEKKEVMKELFKSSYTSGSSSIYYDILKEISKNSLKFLTKVPQQEVSEAIQDGSGEKLLILIRKLFSGGVEFVPVKEGGMPIPIKERCIEGLSFKEKDAYWYTLGHFFQSVGSTSECNGKVLFKILLQVVADPELEVPKIITKMAEGVLFSDNFIAKRLGVKDDTAEIDPTWYRPSNAKLLYSFFTLYNEELKSNKVVMELFSYFSKINHVIKKCEARGKVRRKVFKITRSVPEGKSLGIEKGSIVLLPPFPGDPDPALSSCGFVESIGGKGKNKKYIFILYLDQPWDQESLEHIVKITGPQPFDEPGSDYCKYHATKISKLVPIGVVTEPLKYKILEYLASERFIVDKNEYHSDPVLRRKRDDHLKSLCNEFGTTYVDKEFTIPPEVVSRILEKFDENLTKIPERLSLENIDNALRDLVLKEPKEFEHKPEQLDKIVGQIVEEVKWTCHGVEIQFTPCEIKNVVEEYANLFRPQKGKATLNSQGCSVCFLNKRMKNRVLLPCKHSMCCGCRDSSLSQLERYLSKKEDFIMMNLLVCPLCRSHSILPHGKYPFLDNFFKDNSPKHGVIYRSCESCTTVFEAGETSCQDRTEEMPTECDECRSPLFFSCPECGANYQHDGGCSLMKCCWRGYHGCEDEEDCDHRMCDCIEDCDHERGCGNTWWIGEEEREMGN